MSMQPTKEQYGQQLHEYKRGFMDNCARCGYPEMFVMHNSRPEGEHITMTAEQCNDKHNCTRRDHYATQEQSIRNLRILVKVREEDGPSPVDHIIEKHLNPVIQLFRKKARDYEANNLFTANLLGSQGQFGDLWRKLPKLYKGLWLKQPLTGEQPREILADFIGHCLLALGFLDDEEKIEFRPPTNPADEVRMLRISDALGGEGERVPMTPEEPLR